MVRLVGPGGMSPELTKRWNDELMKAMASPELQKKFADNGLQIVAGSKADFDAEIAKDRAKWGKIIRDFDIKRRTDYDNRSSTQRAQATSWSSERGGPTSCTDSGRPNGPVLKGSAMHGTPSSVQKRLKIGSPV